MAGSSESRWRALVAVVAVTVGSACDGEVSDESLASRAGRGCRSRTSINPVRAVNVSAVMTWVAMTAAGLASTTVLTWVGNQIRAATKATSHG